MKKTNLAKNTLLLSIGTLLNKGLTFLMIPFFSSWLTIEDYGIFDLISTYITLFIPLIGLALTESLFRFSLDTDSEEAKKDFVSTSFAVFTFNIFIVSIVAILLHILNIWNLSLYVCLLLIGEVYMTYFSGYLRSTKKLGFYSIANIISTIFIAIFTTVFIKILNMNLTGIILGYGIGYILGNLTTITYTQFWNKVSFKNVKLSVAIKMLKYSYVLIPNSISWWIINVSDRSIINIFLGASFNGIYAIASKIPNFCTSMFSVFNISWQETAIDMLNTENRDKYYNSVYNKMFILLVTLCSFVLSIQFILFNYIFDLKYYSAHLYTSILILSTIFSTISIFFGGIQISLKNPKVNGISTVVGAISNIIIHLALVKFIGLYAAAISTLLSQIIVCVIRKIYLNKEVNIAIDKKNYLYLIMFIYLGICVYYNSYISIYINFANMLVATLIFGYACKDYIRNLAKKIGGKKNA